MFGFGRSFKRQLSGVFTCSDSSPTSKANFDTTLRYGVNPRGRAFTWSEGGKDLKLKMDTKNDLATLHVKLLSQKRPRSVPVTNIKPADVEMEKEVLCEM